jgi:hypothetical protein
MRIEILEVIDRQRRVVAFDGPAGAAWGYWCGTSEPQCGIFDVELDIPDEIASWDVVSGRDLIEGNYSHHAVTVRGSVQSADDDSVAAIRISGDIVLAEIATDIPAASIGESVEFVTRQIDLYPYLV